MAGGASPAAIDQMFQLSAAPEWRYHGTAQLHLLHPSNASRHVPSVRDARQNGARLALLRNRRQSFAARHRTRGTGHATSDDRREVALTTPDLIDHNQTMAIARDS